jgi:lipopolysaccharide/colanic/teichoic acid biosynthesis glycosyltransferase
VDQPPDPGRLMVRPGITGSAQVTGGTLLTPGEKNELDIWYVRNASFRLDLRILAMTFDLILKTQHCSDNIIADAHTFQRAP